ncbi:MAG: penicillin acylase family protein [Promethearchaeota archaeon]
MRREAKKFIATLIITGITFTLFSITIIAPLAPLGSILFPGTGIWRAPGEVPEAETLYINDLDDEVVVYRDEWGIPHVYAENEEDLAFALGYVHAQDRFFQMDMARREARGLLSEVLGRTLSEEDDILNYDKLNLAIGLEYWAKKSLEEAERLQKEGKIEFMDAFERYADGVNYYITTHTYEWPIEYSILGFKPTDRLWTTLDSMVYSTYMAKMLTWGYDDLERLIIYNELNNENDFFELFNPKVSPYQIPICPNYDEYNDTSVLFSQGIEHPQLNSKLLNTVSSFLNNVKKLPYEKRNIVAKELNAIGSNNWVVDGVKSSTGKPILCNDMHLAWSEPGIWYEAHLVSKKEKLNTYGFTLPGIPFPVVGHNDHIAWGFTNIHYDVLDYFFFTEEDSNHYIYRGSKKEYDKRNYKIPIKGGEIEDFTVKITEDGPVLNEFLEERDLIPDNLDDDKIVITSKWIANSINYIFRAIYEFNHAENRAQFNTSSSYFTTPAQNIVYADIEGNIAIRPTGKVPIRQGNVNGTFPYDGSDASGIGSWTDYVPFEGLPHSENPKQHYLVSANQMVAGPNYTKFFLQHPYAAGYRARRINKLLATTDNGSIGVEKMKDIQSDTTSTAAKYFTNYCINAIEAISESDRTTIMKDALTQLKNWDYNMDKELAAPAIYRKFRELFMKYTFDDEFKGTDIEEIGIYPQDNVLEMLMREKPDSKWFDDIDTTIVEDRDDIIIKAVEKTLKFLEEFYGTDEVSSWRWGDLHKLAFPHILGLDPFGKGPYEGNGEKYTINPSPVNIETGVGVATHGASERMIVDLSDISNSYSCIPSGQRGHSNSKHYSDQLEDLFLQGKYHKQYFYEEAEEFPKRHVESYILFIPSGENRLIIPILTLCLIPAFIIGIVVIIKKGHNKSLRRSSEIFLKTEGAEN